MGNSKRVLNCIFHRLGFAYADQPFFSHLLCEFESFLNGMNEVAWQDTGGFCEEE